MRHATGAGRRRFLTIMKIRALLTLMMAAATAYGGTITGTLQGPSGLPVKNGTLTFNLQQAGLIVGSGSVVPATAACYTSIDGSVVGLPNPLALPVTSITYGSGTMAAGMYFVVFTFYDSAGNHTLASPELEVQLTGTGSLMISPPASFPANAAGITVYAGTVSGAETAQGNTVGATQVFNQNETPVTTPGTLPATNATACSIAFNDTIIPYSGYNVSLHFLQRQRLPGMAAGLAVEWRFERDGEYFKWGSAMEWDGDLSPADSVTTTESWSAKYFRLAGHERVQDPEYGRDRGGDCSGVGRGCGGVHQQHAGIPGQRERGHCGPMPGVEWKFVFARELWRGAHGVLPACSFERKYFAAGTVYQF